ncbi:Alpha/Beta hydrolase protein [Aspergillus californicus]
MASVDEQKELVRRLCQKYPKSPWLPISQLQKATSLDVPVRGSVWIAKSAFPVPGPAIRDVLYEVIDRLKNDYHRITPAKETPVVDVGVEFAFSSPAQYRASSTRLARLTGARVASVAYRLAPAHTFPAPILDLPLAYASLLHPPTGAAYPAVPANKIVLAGNSAGANLALGLVKVLLEMQRLPGSAATFDFHGRPVTLPVPAGVAIVSGWCDQCDSLPSWHSKGETDILSVLQPACMPGHPTDDIWPASPPREVPYCHAATLDHELVSPAAVEDWTGAPPMWFACGCEERGIDGNRVVASQAAKAGVKVAWNEYDGMPHEFMIFVNALPQSAHLFQLWAGACRAFTDGNPGDEVRESSAVRWLMPDCQRVDLGNPVDLAPISFKEVRRKMKEYNETRPVWTGDPQSRKLRATL